MCMAANIDFPDSLHVVCAAGEDGGCEEPAALALPLQLHPAPAALYHGALRHRGLNVAQHLRSVLSASKLKKLMVYLKFLYMVPSNDQTPIEH